MLEDDLAAGCFILKPMAYSAGSVNMGTTKAPEIFARHNTLTLGVPARIERLGCANMGSLQKCALWWAKRSLMPLASQAVSK